MIYQYQCDKCGLKDNHYGSDKPESYACPYQSETSDNKCDGRQRPVLEKYIFECDRCGYKDSLLRGYSYKIRNIGEVLPDSELVYPCPYIKDITTFPGSDETIRGYCDGSMHLINKFTTH